VQHSNVVGCLQDGAFQYRANAYKGDVPWDNQYVADLDQSDAIVEFVIGKFDLVPRKPNRDRATALFSASVSQMSAATSGGWS